MAFGRMPGPGARTFCAKTMRRLSFQGPGGLPKCGMQNAECGMENPMIQNLIPKSETRIPNLHCPIGPPHPAEGGRSLQGGGQPGRCFLPRSSLPPGHDPNIPEMSNRIKSRDPSSPFPSPGSVPGYFPSGPGWRCPPGDGPGSLRPPGGFPRWHNPGGTP
jgi:hypothetical protein